MTAKKKATKKVEPRRVTLTSSQAWKLREAVLQADQARDYVDRLMGHIIEEAGEFNGAAGWVLELGKEVELVEHIADA